jgi:hypothetical protein
MKRRDFLALLGGAAAGWPLAACGQQESPRAKALLFRVLKLEADSAASAIGQFFREIESQLGWTTQLPWSAGTMEQRRFDALRLLRQVPAITEFMMLDADGKEKLRVLRLRTDVVEAGTDLSQDPRFTEAVAHKVYYGPVYLHRQSEPFMILSLAGIRREAGVSVAEVGLKLVWDLVQHPRIGELVPYPRIGEHVVAYVLDAHDRVIGHSAMFTPGSNTDGSPIAGDFGLFQRDFSDLAQVQAARAAGSSPTEVQASRDINGREVLSASASVRGGWHVFVELPVAEADTAVP